MTSELSKMYIKIWWKKRRATASVRDVGNASGVNLSSMAVSVYVTLEE